jgi:uncharacterized protein (DUF111 family)
MTSHERVQYETNVDDMDPRLWPNVIDELLAAGAEDAWITPIVMKKGRPAFTLGVLCDEAAAEDVRATIYRETTTIGLRELPVRKQELDREESKVEVDGQPIRVKRAYDAGRLVNSSVEWEDVAAAAESLGRPAKEVLAAATAAADRRSDQP